MPSQIPLDDLSEGAAPKWCTHCGTQKPLTSFDLDANNADGHKNQCKACRSLIHEENRDSQIDPRIAAIEEEALKKLEQLVAGGTLSPHTDDVIDSFMRFTGGVDGFIRRVNANYYACKPGSQQRTKIDMAFMSLIASQEQDKGALSKMSQDDLQKLFVSTVKQLHSPLTIEAKATTVGGADAATD